MVKAIETESLLTPGSVGMIPEKHLRPLTELEPEQQREAWERAVETAPNGIKTNSEYYKAVMAARSARFEHGETPVNLHRA